MNLLQIIVNITIIVNNNNCLHTYLLCDRSYSKHFVNILLVLTIPNGVDTIAVIILQIRKPRFIMSMHKQKKMPFIQHIVGTGSHKKPCVGHWSPQALFSHPGARGMSKPFQACPEVLIQFSQCPTAQDFTLDLSNIKAWSLEFSCLQPKW